MAKLSDIDWNLLKFEFEVLGKPLEDIAAAYEISPTVMAYQAKDWVQSPLSKTSQINFTNLNSIQELNDEVAAQIKEQSTTQLLLKQNHLLPKYIQLENILLQKSIMLASSLETDTSGAVNAVRALTKVLMDLIKNNPMLQPDAGDEETSGDGAREWKVTFVNSEPSGSGEASPVSDEKEAL